MKPFRGPLAALIWKDAKLFAVDRQAVVMSVVIPILIATILGWLDLSASKESNEKTVALYVDQDHSDVSAALKAALLAKHKLSLIDAPLYQATKDIGEGKEKVAIVIPSGFGKKAIDAMTSGGKTPLTILKDPSEQVDPNVVVAAVAEEATRIVAKQTFGAAGDRGSPVDIKEQDVATGKADWAQSAHDYSGFGLQGLLFFAVESAVALSRERRSGVWRRLKASPTSINLILFSRAISSTILALTIILLMFAIGAGLFGIRVHGSWLGFFGIAICAAVMAATFGLFMSTLGKSETQSRALSILIIFLMLATGGAWFPLSKMPPVVQDVAKFFPVRWAVEGFDAMTWRGLSLTSALSSSGVLLIFSVVFALAATFRFRTLREDF